MNYFGAYWEVVSMLWGWLLWGVLCSFLGCDRSFVLVEPFMFSLFLSKDARDYTGDRNAKERMEW